MSKDWTEVKLMGDMYCYLAGSWTILIYTEPSVRKRLKKSVYILIHVKILFPPSDGIAKLFMFGKSLWERSKVSTSFSLS